MLNQWEIHVEDSCKAHSKINRKIFVVYGSNDVVQPKDGPFGGWDDDWHHLEEMYPKKNKKGRE